MENIPRILGEYIEALSHAKDLVDEGNEPALYALFENSKDYRNSMPNGSAGPIKKQFALYCDISSMKQVELLRLPHRK